MTLEAALKAKLAAGQLNHVSIVAHSDRKNVLTYRAIYRGATGVNKYAESTDPVKAMLEVLK